MFKVQNSNLNFQQQGMFFDAGFSAQQALHEEDHKKEHHMNCDPRGLELTQERLKAVKQEQNPFAQLVQIAKIFTNRLSVQPQDLTVFV